MLRVSIRRDIIVDRVDHPVRLCSTDKMVAFCPFVHKAGQNADSVL